MKDPFLILGVFICIMFIVNILKYIIRKRREWKDRKIQKNILAELKKQNETLKNK
jgi:hypothetical protein